LHARRWQAPSLRRLSVSLARFGGCAIIAGVILLAAASMLHPMDAGSSDSAAAFAEYAGGGEHVEYGAGVGVVLVRRCALASWLKRMMCK
jgi:hypothetical protein